MNEHTTEALSDYNKESEEREKKNVHKIASQMNELYDTQKK